MTDKIANPRLLSLDGLRAVSIGLVIVAHLQVAKTAPVLGYFYWRELGNLGVRVFFVISGFLITTLLLHEVEKYGRISLHRFYLRRALRIFPAYYVFLAVMLLSTMLGMTAIRATDFLAAATYTSNYFLTSWLLSHTWSLSVEEQFYLLWPGVLLLAGRKRGLWIAAALVIVAPAIRTLALAATHWPVNPRYAFEAVGDALATGCLLAGMRDWLWANRRYRKFLTSPWALSIPLLLLASQVMWLFPLAQASLGITLLNVVIALGIDRCMRFYDSPIERLLNSRLFVAAGVLSYSLYLWQTPLLIPGHYVPMPIRLAWLGGAALASYWLIEKPVLRTRGAIESRLLGRREIGEVATRA